MNKNYYYIIIIFLLFYCLFILNHILKKKDNFDNKHNHIIIFYHIASIGDWKYILNEQLRLIKSSGLYHKAKKIYIGFLGNKEDILPYLNNKIDLIYHSNNIKEYEIPTINKLLTFSKTNPNTYILYIHNKGSTKKICNGINGQYYWRQLMNYWNITRFQDNINYLKKGFMTSGINYMNNHYSGNFWWANTNYLRNLNRIISNKNRLNAEFWLLDKNKIVKGKHISLFGPYISSRKDICSGLYGMILDINNNKHKNIKII